MKMSEKIFCVPRMGCYSEIFVDFLKELGLNVMDTPQITKNTIKIGVKHSPNMVCFPFKSTLGNFIECLQQGATDLIMFNSCGQCRLRHYYKMQELIIKELGYNFTMHQLRGRYLFFDLKKFNPSNSYIKIIRVTRKYWMKIKNMEDKYHSEINPNDINIGIVGEIFSCLEPKINMDLRNRLKRKGAKVHTFTNVRHIITDSLGFSLLKDREAKSYLDCGKIGGHAIPNIRDTLYFTRNKIDGMIHLLPLTCSPECMIEPVLNQICHNAKVPLLRIEIDETNNELNMDTRIETFVEIIKRRKGG